jgi:hypothetical protein
MTISSEKFAASHSRWPFSPEENQRRLVNGMGSGVLVDLAIASPLDVERGMLDVRPGRPATVTIRRGNSETAIPLDVKALSATPATPDDLVWRLLGLKTLPVSNDYVGV